MRNPLPNSNIFEQLGKLAREMTLAPVSAELHDEGRNRILATARAERRARRRSDTRGHWVKALLAAAACALVVIGFVAWQRRPLTYRIQGGSRFAAGSLSVSNDEPASIRFSDGSVIDASPGTRIRVDNLGADGARVILESGTASARVHHGKSSSWLFVAGPFEVRVLGTAFDLAWDAAKGEVELVLRQGQTEFRGPLGHGPITVATGQRLRASLRARSLRLDESAVDTAAPKPATSSAEPQNTPEPQNPSEVETRAVTTERRTAAPSSPPLFGKSEAVHRASWSELAQRGQFKAVVDEAQQGNVDNCFATCPVSDLRALADSARYLGRTQLAEQSLKAMRQRAGNGDQRAWAAFMLGRIAEAVGQPARANTWYDTYLSEAPQGQFAADALAGKMQATMTLHGTAAARPLAVQYLQRYPNGVHSAMARKIDVTSP